MNEVDNVVTRTTEAGTLKCNIHAVFTGLVVMNLAYFRLG